MQHAIERVERPGESQEALDGKKTSLPYSLVLAKDPHLFRMEQAALHRMAKSIAQLTFCQVTGEEIETATKLLEKACQKLRGIPEVPPQRITLTMQRDNYINLVAFWMLHDLSEL